jgi:membrane carboxypeptidase/penicillin-binding protein PbpC
VKTGTTTEFRDNWTVGFTPERAVGVWVGNTDNRPMREVSGVDGAGPIWHGVMEAAMAGVAPSWPAPPEGVVRAAVCAPAGLLPGPACPHRVEEWFIAGTEPDESEDYYVRTAEGRLLYNPPAEARAWALSAGLPLAQPPGGDEDAFVVRPSPGSVLFLAGELPSQRALLSASPPAGTLRLDFMVDGEAVGTAVPDDPAVLWNLSPGKHVLVVRAHLAGGRIATSESTFEVRQ